MKRVLAGTAIVLALVAVGAGPAVGRGRSAESADVVTADITFGFQSCSGDSVVFAARLHVVERMGTSADGGLHLLSHSHIHGEGVGVPSGAAYVMNENFESETANFREQDGVVSFEFTTVNGVVAVSQGPLDNTRIFMLTHVTVNANGERTAEVDQVRTECNG